MATHGLPIETRIRMIDSQIQKTNRDILNIRENYPPNDLNRQQIENLQDRIYRLIFKKQALIDPHSQFMAVSQKLGLPSYQVSYMLKPYQRRRSRIRSDRTRRHSRKRTRRARRSRRYKRRSVSR